ncbi:MAG: aromatic ring-hydroxylating dioxygenase subunit alpha [Alphaproteobacteria bacterium]|nr:aromatic ring-hydroxylating dioxygenase subunit alpha [Alphaproteobacteria bacterium]
MFVRNAWYVAAWDDEIGRQPFARTILDEPIVMYRKEDGGIVALEDRCCHRFLPLSRGVLKGDHLQCGYHGMIYDGTGACVEIPWQVEIPSAARVRAYPVVERHRWVWIWMGAAEDADAETITDFHWLDDPDWGARGMRFDVGCDYRLIVENLLDLTHLAYVHSSTIGNAAVAEGADVTFERTKNDVTVTRWTIDQPPPPTYVKAGGFTGNVDRWQIIHFTPPGFVRLDVGACDTGTGAPEGRRKGGIRMRNLNAVTPESEKSTHYFWAQAHDFDVGNQAVTDMVFEQAKIAFIEDLAVFEAQQASIERDPETPMVNLSQDFGGIAARKIIERLAKAEMAAGLSTNG